MRLPDNRVAPTNGTESNMDRADEADTTRPEFTRLARSVTLAGFFEFGWRVAVIVLLCETWRALDRIATILAVR